MKIAESTGSVMEAGSQPNETHILILEEGPGNPKNKCWYGPEAVRDAASAFRGVRMFANHLGRKEAENRPERDVEAIVGRIKETYVREADNGHLQCWGIAKVVEGDSCKWIKERINESVRAVKEGFPPIMQTSINGDGDAESRNIEGDRWNYVKKITRGISVDFVPMGGIKNAGFNDIMESAHLFSGGSMKKKGILQNLSAQDREKFERINGILEAALTPEDQEFVTNVYSQYLREDEGAEDVDVDAADLEGADAGADAAGDEDVNEQIYALTLADGSEIEVGEPDEVDEEGNAYWYTEDGTPIVLAANAGQEEYEEVDEPDFKPELDEDDEEIDFADLAARYPALAVELERAELGQRARESNMDPDAVIGNLQEARLVERTQRVLLESRILAERKLIEAGIPNALLSPDKLVGLTPDMMDREIERALDQVEFIQAMIREAMTINGGSEFSRGSGSTSDPNVGKRILAGACKKD